MIRRIYVAGPITKGDQFANVRAAIDAGEALRSAGLAPFVPHLTVFWHIVHPVPYEGWLTYDLVWLEACHALLRLPGESAGADREVVRARARGLPVYYSAEDCIRAQGTGT